MIRNNLSKSFSFSDLLPASHVEEASDRALNLSGSEMLGCHWP